MPGGQQLKASPSASRAKVYAVTAVGGSDLPSTSWGDFEDDPVVRIPRKQRCGRGALRSEGEPFTPFDRVLAATAPCPEQPDPPAPDFEPRLAASVPSASHLRRRSSIVTPSVTATSLPPLFCPVKPPLLGDTLPRKYTRWLSAGCGGKRRVPFCSPPRWRSSAPAVEPCGEVDIKKRRNKQVYEERTLELKLAATERRTKQLCGDGAWVERHDAAAMIQRAVRAMRARVLRKDLAAGKRRWLDSIAAAELAERVLRQKKRIIAVEYDRQDEAARLLQRVARAFSVRGMQMPLLRRNACVVRYVEMTRAANVVSAHARAFLSSCLVLSKLADHYRRTVEVCDASASVIQFRWRYYTRRKKRHVHNRVDLLAAEAAVRLISRYFPAWRSVRPRRLHAAFDELQRRTVVATRLSAWRALGRHRTASKVSSLRARNRIRLVSSYYTRLLRNMRLAKTVSYLLHRVRVDLLRDRFSLWTEAMLYAKQLHTPYTACPLDPFGFGQAEYDANRHTLLLHRNKSTHRPIKGYQDLLLSSLPPSSSDALRALRKAHALRESNGDSKLAGVQCRGNSSPPVAILPADLCTSVSVEIHPFEHPGKEEEVETRGTEQVAITEQDLFSEAQNIVPRDGGMEENPEEREVQTRTTEDDVRGKQKDGDDLASQSWHPMAGFNSGLAYEEFETAAPSQQETQRKTIVAEDEGSDPEHNKVTQLGEPEKDQSETEKVKKDAEKECPYQGIPETEKSEVCEMQKRTAEQKPQNDCSIARAHPERERVGDEQDEDEDMERNSTEAFEAPGVGSKLEAQDDAPGVKNGAKELENPQVHEQELSVVAKQEEVIVNGLNKPVGREGDYSREEGARPDSPHHERAKHDSESAVGRQSHNQVGRVEAEEIRGWALQLLLRMSVTPTTGMKLLASVIPDNENENTVAPDEATSSTAPNLPSSSYLQLLVVAFRESHAEDPSFLPVLARCRSNKASPKHRSRSAEKIQKGWRVHRSRSIAQELRKVRSKAYQEIREEGSALMLQPIGRGSLARDDLRAQQREQQQQREQDQQQDDEPEQVERQQGEQEQEKAAHPACHPLPKDYHAMSMTYHQVMGMRYSQGHLRTLQYLRCLHETGLEGLAND